jgi:hypothetical protein
VVIFPNKTTRLCWQRDQISEAPYRQVNFETEQIGEHEKSQPKSSGTPSHNVHIESAIRGRLSKGEDQMEQSEGSWQENSKKCPEVSGLAQ